RQGALACLAGGCVGFVETANGILETLPLDEPHGVEGPAIGVSAKTIDRDDAGMFQAAGDLALTHETRPALDVVGAGRLDLLQGNFAIEFRVVREVNLAQSATGKRSDNAVAPGLRSDRLTGNGKSRNRAGLPGRQGFG